MYIWIDIAIWLLIKKFFRFSNKNLLATYLIFRGLKYIIFNKFIKSFEFATGNDLLFGSDNQKNPLVSFGFHALDKKINFDEFK